jgi:hypothetical protein
MRKSNTAFSLAQVLRGWLNAHDTHNAANGHPPVENCRRCRYTELKPDFNRRPPRLGNPKAVDLRAILGAVGMLVFMRSTPSHLGETGLFWLTRAPHVLLLDCASHLGRADMNVLSKPQESVDVADLEGAGLCGRPP